MIIIIIMIMIIVIIIIIIIIIKVNLSFYDMTRIRLSLINNVYESLL